MICDYIFNVSKFLNSMIELSQVEKKFDSLTAVEDISFKIKKGEIVGLVGPNGAGKTTTLRMIAGVIPPTSGKVLINGKNLLKNYKLKTLIGFLPEDNPLYNNMTVEEFLNFWMEIKGIKDPEEQKKTKDFVVKSTGIASVYYRPINQLSKGYRQRVGLSQAILTKPDILLLDEPTEGLDPNQRQEIKKLIEKLGKNRTVIIASHVLSEISKIASRVIIVNKGKVVADDKISKLKQFKASSCLIEAEINGNGVLTKLKQLSGVIKVEALKNNYYYLTADASKDLREDIFKLAKKNNWIILTMFKKEQELEDVFSQLTQEKKDE